MALLQDKVALVTGGARGIGEGIATVFAEHGAIVYEGQGRVARISPTSTVSWQGKEKGRSQRSKD